MHRGTFVSCGGRSVRDGRVRAGRPRLVALALFACCGTVRAQATGPADGPPLRTYPVTGETLYVVSNDTGGVAGAGERLIYDNPLGAYAAELRANVRASDDLTLAVGSGCRLTDTAYASSARRSRRAVAGWVYRAAR